MIQRPSHTTLYVTDQDAARDFYVNKLGLELRIDQETNGFRWLTVGPKTQPDFQLILMKIGANMGGDETSSTQLRTLVSGGKLGAVGVFETADCRKTHAELVTKGVEFVSAPEEKFYGVEAVFRDPSGNRFSLTQVKKS